MTGELQYNASDANIYYTNTTASSSANVGQLILGTSTPGTVAVLTVNANVTPIASMPQVAPVGTIVQLCAEDGQGVQFCMDSFGSLSSFVGRSASGTAASPTALSSNRGICRVIAEGWDGTSYYRAAQINFGTAEAFTSSNGGSQIVFQTTPTGTHTLQVSVLCSANGGLSVGTDNSGTDPGNGVVLADIVTTGKAYTVATLPTAGTMGRRAFVTDASSPTFLGTLTGGGSMVCPVFDNGTAWVAG